LSHGRLISAGASSNVRLMLYVSSLRRAVAFAAVTGRLARGAGAGAGVAAGPLPVLCRPAGRRARRARRRTRIPTRHLSRSPLAFWLAEVAFDLAGRSMIGVYLLSQACVVVTYWAVVALARSIVGAQHAALAVC